MQLELQRIETNDICTIGKLSVDGHDQCYALEDPIRPDGVKIPGETAIPAGEYQVDITHSARFDCDLPLLLNVENFVGIRIHPGNTANDTEGCILVGKTRDGNSIGQSRAAFHDLFPLLQAAKARDEPITISVRNPP